MKKKLLIVVDYQKDFVDGALGNPAAAAIEENIVNKIREYRALGEGGQVIFTMDTHGENYMQTQEGLNLPVAHCIEGSEGWTLYGKTADMKKEDDIAFFKRTFGSIELGDYLKDKGDRYESVELCGVVTNICVISNMVVTKAAMPEVPIIIDASCCASNDPVMESKAYDIMENLHAKVLR
ncbi:MAG: cysteine hydrolase [Firmicutes bacterium]|nr:cysteine hydrolase [Bacillota bacterium]